MKNDYLWDKTGSDAEIEGLENVFASVRYVTSDPPELPATNIIEFAKKPQRRWFAYLFAAAGCATLVMLAGVWLRSGETGIEVAKTDEIAAPTIVKRVLPPKSTPPISKLVEQQELPATTVAATPKIYRPRAVRVKHRFHRPQPPVVLTAEEKYAYGQLMLALSITGSKLRVVRDMIDGPESKAAVVNDK